MKGLKRENIDSILFIDIETAPQWEKLEDAPEYVRKEWIYKFKYKEGAPTAPNPEKNANDEQAFIQNKYLKYFSDLWEKQAGLYPEFAKIICITAGYMVAGTLRLKSYYDASEANLLERFSNDVRLFSSANTYLKLCAHYGKGFDYPFTIKRLLIHRKPIPPILDSYGLKPWEVVNLDTQEIWKVGGYGSSATLSSIAMAFGIPSPKDDIEGADVARCYYAGEIDRIVTYCEKDVITLVNVFKSMRGEALLREDQIQKVVM